MSQIRELRKRRDEILKELGRYERRVNNILRERSVAKLALDQVEALIKAHEAPPAAQEEAKAEAATDETKVA